MDEIERIRELAEKVSNDLLASIAEIKHDDDAVFLATLALSWPTLLARIEAGERLAEAVDGGSRDEVTAALDLFHRAKHAGGAK